jgi:hypothetical protein
MAAAPLLLPALAVLVAAITTRRMLVRLT